MIFLVTAAVIWGIAFVAQSVGTDFVPGFTFNGIRFILGGLVLLPYIWFFRKKAIVKTSRKDFLISGLLCSLCLFGAANLQQQGMKYTSAGKAGFITTFYIVIVPVIGVFLGKKITKRIVAAVALAFVGLYLLCITDTFTVSKGDWLIFGAAIIFSVHILVIDYFSDRVDGVRLSCTQFLVCGILSMLIALFFEEPNMGGIMMARIPILYTGIMSCGVAYTFQILGQKKVNPTIASLILSTEACVSVLAGWLILGEQLSSKEFIGCIVMLGAVVLAQLPKRKMA